MRKIILITIFSALFLTTVNAADKQLDEKFLPSTTTQEISFEEIDPSTYFHEVDSECGDDTYIKEEAKKSVYISTWDDKMHFKYAKFLWNSIDVCFSQYEYQEGKEKLVKIASSDQNEFQFDALKLLFSSFYASNQDLAVAGIEFYAKTHLLDEALEAKKLLWQNTRHHKKAILHIKDMVKQHPNHKDVLFGPKLMYTSVLSQYKIQAINLMLEIVNNTKNQSVKIEVLNIINKYKAKRARERETQKGFANFRFLFLLIGAAGAAHHASIGGGC
jgi:hypothetical protein